MHNLQALGIRNHRIELAGDVKILGTQERAVELSPAATRKHLNGDIYCTVPLETKKQPKGDGRAIGSPQ